MLVLSRRVGEKIWIGDDVQVVVIAIRGNTVRLGIEAPRDIHVRRDELSKEGHDNPKTGVRI